MTADVGQSTQYAGFDPGPFTVPTALNTNVSGSTFGLFFICTGTLPTAAQISDEINGVASGNTYSEIGADFTGFGGGNAAIFYCQNGVGGTNHTFTTNWTGGAAQQICVMPFEIVGGVASGILDQISSAMWKGVTPGPFTANAITPSQAAELVLAFCISVSNSGTEVPTFGSGFNTVQYQGDANSITGGIARQVINSTSPLNISYTLAGAGSTEAATALVSFKAAATAAALAGAPAAGASATGALATGIAAAGAAVSAASATGALTTAIKLATAAVASMVASGALGSGVTLAGSAAATAAVTDALTTGIALSAVASISVTDSATATNWVSVVLTSPLTMGLGSLIDAHLWPTANRLPQVGDTIYYDPAHITVNADSTVTSNSNNCAAVVQFNDGTAMRAGIVVFTPFMVGEADSATTSAGVLTTAILLAGAMMVASSSTGTFGLGALMAGAASVSAMVTDALTTGIPLAGALIAALNAAGAIGGGGTFSATADSGSITADSGTVTADQSSTPPPLGGYTADSGSITADSGFVTADQSSTPPSGGFTADSGSITADSSTVTADGINNSVIPVKPANIFFSVQKPSPGGLYWPNYPQGNRPQ